jgi:beta-lactam-binding protein with PASTA domain
MIGRLIAALFFGISAIFVFWYALVHTVHLGTLTVPDLRGSEVLDAEKQLHDLGISLVVEDDGAFSTDISPGLIAVQHPHSGFHVKTGSTISVRLSLGSERAQIREIRGESLQTGLRSLEQDGLRPAPRAEVRGQADSDSILATAPPQGTAVAPDTEVKLLVNKTPARQLWVMPSLLSLRVDTVRRFCRRHHFRLGQVHEVRYPGLSGGVVLRQYPAAGSPLSRSDIITIWVSQ